MRLGPTFRSAFPAVRRFLRPRRPSAAIAWCLCRFGWRQNWLYTWRLRDQQVNNSELARRLGVHERVVRRLLDPRHATRTEKIQAALAILGKQMTVEVQDAA